MEGFPFMAIADLWGNPTASHAPIPSNGVAMMLVVDAEGNPTVSPVFSGATDSELRREADAAGTGMVVSLRKKASAPGFVWTNRVGMDDWRCNDFSDSFNRGDGPMRSLPDYPWEAGLAGHYEIVSFQAKYVGGAAGVGLWVEDTFYPAYLSQTTYSFPPYNSTPWRWGFFVDGVVAAETTLIEANITVENLWPFRVYLSFWLWWGGLFSISDTWEVGAHYSEIPTIVNGQTLTGSSNGYGRVSATWIGHTFSHQF